MEVNLLSIAIQEHKEEIKPIYIRGCFRLNYVGCNFRQIVDNKWTCTDSYYATCSSCWSNKSAIRRRLLSLWI